MSVGTKYVKRSYPFQALVMGAGRRLLVEDMWNSGLRKDMPQHYKDFYQTWRKGPQTHIHSRPKQENFVKDEFGEIHPVQNPRIYVVYPDKFHEGLWGGEGVIKGLLARDQARHRNFTPPGAKYWWPTLYEGVVHSEILDRHIEMVMTKRGVRLVDEACGFDNYLLSTPVNEVYATGLLRIKRELLLALASKENFTTRAGGSPAVYEKYQQFVVGHEEADWHGLTLPEAKKKQAAIERLEKEAEMVPSKEGYRRELLEVLRMGKMEELEIGLTEGEDTKGGMIGGMKDMLGLK